MDSAPMAAPGPSTRATGLRLAWIFASLAVVTAALAVFGVEHNPSYTFSIFGNTATDAIDLKSKIATAVLGLAILQLLLALWIYGRLPAVPKAANPVRHVHRTIGIVAFLATLPVAIHCIFAYGFQTTSARVTIHSLAGCFFYGAFVAKVLVVRSKRLPRWVLPVAGGLVVTLVGVLWYTSALWFFNNYRLPG